MKQFHILFLMLMLGLFLMPGVGYACGMKMEKSCCKKETPAKAMKSDCCKKNKESKDSSKDCGGNCGHANCTASTSQFSLFALNEIEFKKYTFDFATEKQKFYHNETTTSSGFYSVWSPPKIQ